MASAIRSDVITSTVTSLCSSCVQSHLDEVPDAEVCPTGRTGEDREAEQKHEAAVASTSGRLASATRDGVQGVPGVFIVHSDGTVATDAAYST